MKRWGLFLHYAVTMAVLTAVWQLYVSVGHVSSFLLPAPVPVLDALWQSTRSGQLLAATGATCVEILVGFGVGSVLGVGLGALLSRSQLLRTATGGVLLFFQTAPKIALAPLFILWFGLGLLSKLVLVISLVFFPAMVATSLGIASVSGPYVDLANLLQLGPARRFFRIELPLALPEIFAGLKVGLVQAVIGAIVAEWMAGNAGLGYLMVYGDTTFNTPLLVAAILMTVVVSVVFTGLLSRVEARLLGWHAAYTTEAASL